MINLKNEYSHMKTDYDTRDELLGDLATEIFDFLEQEYPMYKKYCMTKQYIGHEALTWEENAILTIKRILTDNLDDYYIIKRKSADDFNDNPFATH